MQVQNVALNTVWRKLRTLTILSGALIMLIALVRWGGTAQSGLLFVAGVTLLIGLIAGLGALIWWLYLSPLPAGAAIRNQRASTTRQVIATLALVSVSMFVLGGFWDELWHRRYGGFGNDFLWPPHMLLYLSIALFACFAGTGMFVALRQNGTIRQRFRAEPLLGLLGLVAAYLLASLPSDELWHRIYGKDLTAWSLPHLILAGGVILVALVAAGVQLSVAPLRPWRGLRGMSWQETIALLLIVAATTLLIQFGTTEWDGIQRLQSGRQDAFADAFWQRPPWLYPVVVAMIALFSGNWALHSLRRAGVATLVGIAALGFRLACLWALGSEATVQRLGYTAHLLIVPPLLALDAWYAAQKFRADRTATLIGGNAVATAVFLAAGLPLIARMMVWPPVTSATILPMIGMSVIMGLCAGWAGARFGGWLGTLDRQDEEAALNPRVRWLSLAGFAVALVVVAAVMLTAQPPST